MFIDYIDTVVGKVVKRTEESDRMISKYFAEFRDLIELQHKKEESNSPVNADNSMGIICIKARKNNSKETVSIYHLICYINLMDNLGYCCINQTLRKKDVYTGRSLIRRTFSIEKASQLALQNCIDLLAIMQWNVDNDINVFRIGSDLFPRITDNINRYSLNQLSTENQIYSILAQVGKLAYDNNIILSCHPGPYTVLGSDTETVVNNSIDEINMHVLVGKILRTNAPKLRSVSGKAHD